MPAPVSHAGRPRSRTDETGPRRVWRVPSWQHAWYSQSRPLFTGGNEVELLRGAGELVPAMQAAIDAAVRDVWFATYIFHEDAMALSFADTLAAAARRGINVRVVVDGFGSRDTLPTLRAKFAEAKVAFAVFRPVTSLLSLLQPGQLRRLHQKVCVVDGEVAFVGGTNVIDDRLDLRHGWSDAPRLDYAVGLRGPVVRFVEQTARAAWTRAWVGQDWREEVLAMAKLSEPVARARRLWHDIRPGRGRIAGASAQDEKPVRVAFVVRDNLRQRHTIERSYIETIADARERVDVVSPYFYPGREFRAALVRAAGRGVRVRLLMQGRWDYRTAELAARALYAELLGRGVEIYEYMPAFLHAKVALVDDEWATVGSSNIDPLSLLLNLEANAIVVDRDFAATLGRELDAAFAVSRRVSRAEAGGRYHLLHRAAVAWCARVFLRIAGATGRY
jgi:cardiolipin synthase